ncbi:MAG: polysaccharide deacetylase family protein [Nanoarchaeota archaeon]
MKKTFTLRVDLESDKGIRKGLPKLLDLLKIYGIKASFYLVMGGESNVVEIIKYREKMKSSGERLIKLWSFRDKLRMALFPRDFVKGNLDILKRVLDEGHELGLHGWKHREWTRGLKKISVRDRIHRAKMRYARLFGRNPISFASPGFNVNDEVLKALSEEEIKFISDYSGEKIEIYNNIKNVPITICGNNRMPIIEFLVSHKKSDEEIFRYIKKEMKGREISSFYIHDLFEARFKLKLLERIFNLVKEEKITNKRIIDY